MKKGTTVEWQSQSQGSWKKKQGKIVEVVPAHTAPVSPLKMPGGPRVQESYVVSVQTGPKAKPKLYWPRVSDLKAVK